MFYELSGLTILLLPNDVRCVLSSQATDEPLNNQTSVFLVRVPRPLLLSDDRDCLVALAFVTWHDYPSRIQHFLQGIEIWVKFTTLIKNRATGASVFRHANLVRNRQIFSEHMHLRTGKKLVMCLVACLRQHYQKKAQQYGHLHEKGGPNFGWTGERRTLVIERKTPFYLAISKATLRFHRYFGLRMQWWRQYTGGQGKVQYTLNGATLTFEIHYDGNQGRCNQLLVGDLIDGADMCNI